MVACNDSDGEISLTEKLDFKVIDNVVVYDNDGIHWNAVSILSLNNCSEVDLLFKANNLFMCIRQEIAGNKSYLEKSCILFLR